MKQNQSPSTPPQVDPAAAAALLGRLQQQNRENVARASAPSSSGISIDVTTLVIIVIIVFALYTSLSGGVADTSFAKYGTPQPPPAIVPVVVPGLGITVDCSAAQPVPLDVWAQLNTAQRATVGLTCAAQYSR